MNATTLAERMRITSGGDVNIGVTGTATPRVSIIGNVGSDTAANAPALIISNSQTSGTRQWAIQLDSSNQLRTFYFNGSSWVTNGYQTTGGTWTNSDERRKENISLLSYGLSEVLKLTPKKFNFKIDEYKKPYMGFIAQDIVDIIPESVQSYIDGEEQYYAMNYDNLVPILVKAIQELSAQIEELKAKLA
jgi:hypothetical protein